jgi:cytochrome c oxidase assembly factor CtaG
MFSASQAALHAWSLPVPVTCVLALLAITYSRGWIHLRNVFPDLFPGWRLVAFLSGLASLWVAVGSPLAALDDELLLVHMLQHILLMAVAPPLILLGSPSHPLLHGLPQRFVRGTLGPVLRLSPLQWLGRTLTQPAICWLVATITVIAWHFPVPFEFALRSETWHEVEHASFFTTSILFWWPVMQPWPSAPRWPRWSIPLYVFLGMLANDAVSSYLAFCDRVIYPSYATGSGLLDLSPLEDQAIAGALMWVSGTFLYLIPAVVITIQTLTHDEKKCQWSGRCSASSRTCA